MHRLKLNLPRNRAVESPVNDNIHIAALLEINYNLANIATTLSAVASQIKKMSDTLQGIYGTETGD